MKTRFNVLMKYLVFAFFFLSVQLTFLSCNEERDKKVRIGAAASMQYVIKELATDFTDRTNINCDIIIGSSGKLTAQIVEGAPYNILLSADMKYPELIYSKSLSLDSPEIFSYGKLVLWTADAAIDPSLDALTHPGIERIAIANPKTAPFGEVALALLGKNGILDAVSDKLVYGESIAQTNQFISTKAVSMGFTSLSSVLAEPMKELGKWNLIPEEQYAPIPHGAVVIDMGKDQNELAKEFYNYLFSEEAGKILEEFGYSRDE